MKKINYLKIISLLAIISICSIIIFVLPYLFPPTNKIVSESYNMGFNNTVSIIGALILIVLIVLWNILFNNGHEFRFSSIFRKGGFSLKEFNLWAALPIVLLYVGSTFLFYFIFQNKYYGEASYFLRRLDLIQLGKAPYTDFEFCYGPLMLYFPWLIYQLFQFINISLRASYYFSYAILNLTGLFMLIYFIGMFNANKRTKSVIFTIIALLSFNVSMGVNYIILRFLLPFVGMIAFHAIIVKDGLKLHNNAIKAGFIMLLMVCVNVMISPEIGIAFFLALFVYLTYLAIVNDWKYIYLIITVVLFALLLIKTVSSDYLLSVLALGSGGINFPIVPSPPILMFLFSLAFLVSGIIMSIFKFKSVNDPLLLGFVALFLFLLAPAFGRADSAHVYWNGLGMFIITGFYLMNLNKKLFKYYLVAFVLIFFSAYIFGFYAVSLRPFVYSLYKSAGNHISSKKVVEMANFLGINKEDVEKAIQKQSVKVNDYSKLNKYAKIATPLEIDESLDNYLKKSGKYVPEYFLNLDTVLSQKQLNRKISELKTNTYVLISKNFLVANHVRNSDSLKKTERYLSLILFFPIKYLHKREPIDYNKEVVAYVIKNYNYVALIGDFCLFKKKGVK